MIPHQGRSYAALGHDVMASALAWTAAFWLRFNLDIPGFYVEHMLKNMLWIIPLQLVSFLGWGLYRGIWRYASVPDLKRIVFAAGCAVAGMFLVVRLVDIPHIPRSVFLVYPIILVMIMGGSRLLYRAWKEHVSAGRSNAARHILVLGAGDAAADLIKHLSRSRQWRVMGLLDDNAARLGRQINGVTVLGELDNLDAVSRRLNVEEAVIAMPEATHQQRRRALEICSKAGLRAMTIPSLTDIVSGKVTVSQIRKIELDDLLGRPPVSLDTSGLTEWLAHHTVMVTGAGGSIGSELCRQLARFHPELIVLYELNEFALYSLEQEFRDAFPDIPVATIIGDVKDINRLEAIIKRYQPTTLFHAAAYKHVPLMEDVNAGEAIRNNVLGTLRTARAAIAGGVQKFVLVSTDKAVNPTNVMGASKRLAELVCSSLQKCQTRFVTVRFGNVLGSTGSVIPKFREQILAGGPVTVTHPEITRYFMSIPEAAQLVLQAGLMGKGGEIFVLDMGDPIKIVDLARDLIRLSGFSDKEIRIEFSGLRPGEKLYEELLADGETTLPTPHPKLRIALSTEVTQDWLKQLEDWLTRLPADGEEVRSRLAEQLSEYASSGS
jgi:FlaA1/EpsC-like NDP-sugar epimerase